MIDHYFLYAKSEQNKHHKNPSYQSYFVTIDICTVASYLHQHDWEPIINESDVNLCSSMLIKEIQTVITKSKRQS